MIHADSRYRESVVTKLETTRGLLRAIVPSEQQEYMFNFRFHRVLGPERIDEIANLYYGDDTKWWMIGDANPEILDWSSLTPGTLIRIPNAG